MSGEVDILPAGVGSPVGGMDVAGRPWRSAGVAEWRC